MTALVQEEDLPATTIGKDVLKVLGIDPETTFKGSFDITLEGKRLLDEEPKTEHANQLI
jgi:hypothetical protein